MARTDEIGRIGQKRYGGTFYEEFLRELRGKKGIETYREMAENDDTIGAILFAVEMLIRQASWNVEPGGDTPKDKEAAEFVEQCMHDMQDTWTDISKGTVKIPRGLEAETISWDGTFYGKSKRNEVMIREWTSPAECVKVLRNWMIKGTVLRLLATETNINYDVTISDFEPIETGAYGNIDYSITFTIYKELKIYTTSELKIAAFVKKTVPRPTPAPQSSRTHTVKSGDTLWGIASKYYGSGTSWQKIYSANSSTIEATAKRYRGGRGSDNGHWIYPGTVLTIP